MAFDFPVNPAVDQEITFGDITYVFNGNGWAVKEVLPPAPIDAYTKPESEALFVEQTGDTMTGFLTLHAPPDEDMHAATKAYVDAAVIAGGGVGDFLPLTGGILTGNLGITKNAPSIVLERNDLTLGAALEGRVGGLSRWVVQLGYAAETATDMVGSDFRIQRFNNAGINQGTALEINRATGNVAVGKNLTVGSTITIGSSSIVVQGPGSGGDVNAGSYLGAFAAGTGASILIGNKSAILGGTFSGQGTIWSAVGDIHVGNQLAQPVAPTAAEHLANKAYVDGTLSGISAKVAKAGDTMTGDLTINKLVPGLKLNKTGGAGSYNSIDGLTNGVFRWRMLFGNITGETGSNAGSDFYIINYDDAGNEVAGGYPLYINRATGLATIKGNPTAALGIVPKQYADTKLPLTGGTINGNLAVVGNHAVNGSMTLYGYAGNPAMSLMYMNQAGSAYFHYDGANFHHAGGGGVFNGNLSATGNITTAGGTISGAAISCVAGSMWTYGHSGNPGLGIVYFGNGGGAYHYWDGANHTLAGGQVFAGGFQAGAGPVVCGAVTVNGVSALQGTVYFRQPGVSGWTYSMDTDSLHQAKEGWGVSISTHSNWFQSFNDTCAKPSGGPWIQTSDARIKTISGDYTKGLAELLQVVPKRYIYRGNETLGVDSMPPAAERAAGHPYPKSASFNAAAAGKEFIGIVAQEIEPIFPETISQWPGSIDGEAVTDLRIFDGNALTYALINAVKELAARVAQLEAQLATKA